MLTGQYLFQDVPSMLQSRTPQAFFSVNRELQSALGPISSNNFLSWIVSPTVTV